MEKIKYDIFVKYLTEQGFTQQTTNLYLTVANAILKHKDINFKTRDRVRTFLTVQKHLKSCGLIKRDFYKKIKIKNNREKKVYEKTPNDEQLETIISNVSQKYKFICWLSAHSGLRLNEILALEKSNIHIQKDNSIHIVIKHGKGGKFRNTYVIGDEQSEFRKQIKTFKNFSHIKQSALQKHIRYISLKIGINFSFHSLRHYFATYLIRKNIDIYTVSKLLGHSRVGTTEIYTNITCTDISNKLKQYNLI